jgi:hypothetical protein
MTAHPLPRLISLTVAGAVGLLMALAPAAAASSAPEMSVTISDGVDTVTSGTALTYTTKVENLGADPVDAKVVLAVPSYVKIEDPGTGRVDHDTSTWTVTVAPGATSTLKLTAKVRSIPASEVRVTAVASVYVDGVTPSPLIRTADADHITGVADTPHATPAPRSAVTPQWDNAWTAVIVFAALLIAAALVALVIARRRTAHRHRPTA